MVFCFGEPPGGFCDVGCCSLLFLWYFLLFFIHCCFCDVGYCSSFIAFARHPSSFCELSLGFYTHFILSAQFITEWFTALSFFHFPGPSFTVLPCALRFWVGIFYPQAFFTLCSFPHFCHNLLLSRPLWESAVLPWSFQGFMLTLETQIRPICLFDSHKDVQ